MRSIPILLLLVVTLATPALASDGVLEINQACATSTSGCFPGDAAGFPVTITQSGSYRLTSNLNVPANATAIQINSTLVTLDLGGFLVSGPNVCTGYPVTTCDTFAASPGIVSPAQSNFLVTVRNGRVTGMAGDGIKLMGDSSKVEDVSVLSCGGTGIRVGNYGGIFRSVSVGNFFEGIRLDNGGTAEGNESRGNRGAGFYFDAAISGTIVGNRSIQNAQDGFAGRLGPPQWLFSKNVSAGNVHLPYVGVETLGDNYCSITTSSGNTC